jgi:D-3-phosphoglycerate dehydrogenase
MISPEGLRFTADLKLAVIARGGPTNANLKAATQRGVLVCNAPGRNGTATAEHTLSLILAVLRRIPETHAALAQGEWRGDYYEYDKCGLELEDSTAGLIGYGAIGSRVARMLRGFGCHVLAYDPYAKQRASETWRKMSNLMNCLLHHSNTPFPMASTRLQANDTLSPRRHPWANFAARGIHKRSREEHPST